MIDIHDLVRVKNDYTVDFLNIAHKYFIIKMYVLVYIS